MSTKTENGIFLFEDREKNWGQGVNQNFEQLNSVLNKNKEFQNKIYTLENSNSINEVQIEQNYDSLYNEIQETKNQLLETVSVLSDKITTLQYKLNNLSSVQNADRAVFADSSDF